MFILVTLDPQKVPLLLSPLNSKFGVQLQDRYLNRPTDSSILHETHAPAVHESVVQSSLPDKNERPDQEDVSTGMISVEKSLPSSLSSLVPPISTVVIQTDTEVSYEPNKLSTSPALSGPGSDSRWIMLDWAVDDRLFTIENYKALESILTVYPESPFRVILAAPNDAYTHKTGNQLSVMHFVKYKRKGYDIEVLPSGMIKNEVASSYTEKYIKKCCHRCNAKCRISDHVQPYHVLTFIRLSKIFRRGGIFSDFTFFFLGPLEPPEVTQGFYMKVKFSFSF